MDHQGPLDVDAVKNLLDILHDNLSKQQKELHELMVSSFQELSGVKSELSEQKPLLTSLAEQYSGLRAGIDAVVKPVSEQNNEHSDAAFLRRKMEENDELKQRHAELQSEYAKTLKDLEKARSENRRAEETEHSHRIQISRMQNMITKNATNANEVIDSTVIQNTCELRARIQAIVGKYCSGKFVRLRERKKSEMKEWDEEWYQRERGLPDRCTADDVKAFCQFWTRSKIFCILERDIFGRPVYGLAEELERPLCQFEAEISKQAQDRDSQVAEWRSLTLRCAKTLRLAKASRPKHTAEYIKQFLDPWFVASKKGGSSIIYPETLENELLELCDRAYSLALTLRQSTDNYFFMTIPENTKVAAKDETDFEPQDMIGPKHKLVGSRVWLTVFGALVKKPQAAAPGETYIMEKAHVICRAPTPLPARENHE